MLLVTYAQENLSWAFGFGIPFILMLIAFILFLSGTKTYHFTFTPIQFPTIQDANRPLLTIFPIWLTILVFTIVYAQETTFFTKQGATMDRSISSNFTIPAAALAAFVPLSSLVFISIYDVVFIPIARSFTGIQSSITTLQRIGTGLVISAGSMGVAAMVERKRLRVAEE